MKYIIFDNGTGILFSNMQNHSDMTFGRNVVSAGFCRVETTRNQFDDIIVKDVQCYGKSDSLGITSHSGDSEIIRDIFLGMNN